jgi:hypothetical protein
MADSSLLGPPRTTSPPRMARDALTGCPAFGWGLRPIIQARRRNTRHRMRQGRSIPVEVEAPWRRYGSPES